MEFNCIHAAHILKHTIVNLCGSGAYRYEQLRAIEK